MLTHIVRHIFRTPRPTYFKLGIRMEDDVRHQLEGHVVCLRVTGRLTQTHKTCHIFRTVRHKTFNVGVRMEDVDPHQLQAP